MKDTDFNKICIFFDNSFQFGVHSSNGSKSRVWEVAAEPKCLPYLRAENWKGSNIFMRPLPKLSEYYMLVDDLDKIKVLEHMSRPGRMVIESSPCNYQVWIRTVNPLADAIKKELLLQFGSDPGAAPNKRWGRAPGFTNRKAKYARADGLYPFAKLCYLDFGSDEIALPEASVVTTQVVSCDASRKTASDSICRSDFETGDPSRTDIRFCMSLVRRGMSDCEIREILISERLNWEHHASPISRDKYIERTIKKARLWTKV